MFTGSVDLSTRLSKRHQNYLNVALFPSNVGTLNAFKFRLIAPPVIIGNCSTWLLALGAVGTATLGGACTGLGSWGDCCGSIGDGDSFCGGWGDTVEILGSQPRLPFLLLT